MSRLQLNVGGLPWLVAARNEIQELLLLLHDKWDSIPPNDRQWALGAAFSLWRAVFLIYSETAQRSLREPALDQHARKYLLKVIETNAIGFGDDRDARSWTGGYYVNDAIFRVREILQVQHDEWPEHETLRDAWNWAFQRLRGFIEAQPA